MKNPFVQGALLILLAVILAVGTNAFAGRQRRLLLVGFYPNALRVPPREPEMVPPPPVTETAAQPSTAGQPPAAIDTTTAGTGAPAPTATSTPAATTTAPAAAAPAKSAAPAPAAPARPAENPLARFQPHPDKPYVEISGEDAMLLHGAGALFLDARRSANFEESHIAGARPFSVWESDIDDKVNALFGERGEPEQQNLPIVVYCTGGACEDSHMLAQKLWGIQFNNVYVYKDGFPDWQKRGGKVRTGGQP